jgi:hypothetical protein
MNKRNDHSRYSFMHEFHGNEIALGLAFIIPWTYIGIKAFLLRAPFTNLDWYLITVTPLLFLAMSFFFKLDDDSMFSGPRQVVFFLTIMDSALFLVHK